MIEEYDLLLCLQGDEESDLALEYSLHLADALRRPVTVLGIHRLAKKDPLVAAQMERAAGQLRELGIACRVENGFGRLPEVVPTYTSQHPYFTLYNAPPQTIFRRWMYGGRFRRLLADIRGPILRVTGMCWPVENILVCTGGLSYANPLEALAFDLASRVRADVTLLHVVPPVTLDYQLAQEVVHHWQSLLETDTPQARHLRAALQAARDAGVTAELKLRHGQVVDEILAELEHGPYNMIALGSPYSSHSLARLYRPNVTAGVALEANCPLLTIHV